MAEFCDRVEGMAGRPNHAMRPGRGRMKASETVQPYTASMSGAHDKETLRDEVVALQEAQGLPHPAPAEAQEAALGPAGKTGRSWRLSLLVDPLPWLALVTVFTADQVSKTLVIRSLTRFESWPTDGFFRFTHAWNTGTAFGLFPQYGGLLTIVSLVAVVILVLFYRMAKNPSAVVRVAFGMQIGGAFGNLFDRLRIGHVTDFLDVGPWPVFNLADSSIVVGIALMAWHFWNASRVEQTARSGAKPTGRTWCHR